jgi:hypothetical protein
MAHYTATKTPVSVTKSFDPSGAVQSLRLSAGINMPCREKDPSEASGIHLQYSCLCRRRTAQYDDTPSISVARIGTLLREHHPALHKRSRMKTSDLKAFFKSIWYLGIKENGRRYYWRLVISTSLK